MKYQVKVNCKVETITGVFKTDFFGKKDEAFYYYSLDISETEFWEMVLSTIKVTGNNAYLLIKILKAKKKTLIFLQVLRKTNAKLIKENVVSMTALSYGTHLQFISVHTKLYLI